MRRPHLDPLFSPIPFPLLDYEVLLKRSSPGIFLLPFRTIRTLSTDDGHTEWPLPSHPHCKETGARCPLARLLFKVHHGRRGNKKGHLPRSYRSQDGSLLKRRRDVTWLGRTGRFDRSRSCKAGRTEGNIRPHLDVVSRSLRRKSVDIPGEDGRSEIDDPFPLPLLLPWEGKQRGYPGVVKDERTKITTQNV